MKNNDQNVCYSFIFVEKTIQKMTLKILIILNANRSPQPNWETDGCIRVQSWWQYSRAYMFVNEQEKFCYHMLFSIFSMLYSSDQNSKTVSHIQSLVSSLFHISYEDVNHSPSCQSIIINPDTHISIFCSSVLFHWYFQWDQMITWTIQTNFFLQTSFTLIYLSE